MQDQAAFLQVQVVISDDLIFHVNIDGICALRVQMHGDAELVIRDFRNAGAEAAAAIRLPQLGENSPKCGNNVMMLEAVEEA